MPSRYNNNMARFKTCGSLLNTHIAAVCITICLVITIHGLAAQRPAQKAIFGQMSRARLSEITTATAAEHGGGPDLARRCHAMNFVEMSGGQLVSHAGLHTNSPGECCEACLNYVPSTTGTATCNVWSWCGDEVLCANQYRRCILKHVPPPHSQVPVNVGPAVGWMSGVVASYTERQMSHHSLAASLHQAAASTHAQQMTTPAAHSKVRKYHTITSQGTGIYAAWLMRIHYYWFRKVKDECERTLGAACEMGEFTRLLHTGQPDDLMDEIPTMVVDSLPKEDVEAYPPLNRPYAVLQWIQQADITEDFVMIAEADELFLRPMPNLMGDSLQLVGPKVYFLKPSDPHNLPLIAQFLPSRNISPQDAANFPNAGCSPIFISKEQLQKLAPLWHDLTVRIAKDPSATKQWRWMREMYAFIIAVHIAGFGQLDVEQPIVALPPYDLNARGMKSPSGGDYYTVHYSYSFDYALNGTFTPDRRGAWHFYKQDYFRVPPPRNIPTPPPFVQNDMIRKVIDMINEATANIPCWDQYVETMRKPSTCDEVIITPHTASSTVGSTSQLA